MTTKSAHVLICGLLLATGSTSVAAEDQKPLAAGREPTDERYLAEVMRHLYRWYLDENDMVAAIKRGHFLFWVREVKPRLDPGDRSRFVEIILPDLGVYVKAKRADYKIPELAIEVRSTTFRITDVVRGARQVRRPADAVEVKAQYKPMRDHLSRTRHRLQPPTDGLLERLRKAARKNTLKYLNDQSRKPLTTPQTIHLGPVSPVANETGVFWEEGRVLYRFSSDIDLANPAFWKHEKLGVDLFSIAEQVVVSLDEVAGSNAYLTRDQVGRVLFNCLVFGRRVTLTDVDKGPISTGDTAIGTIAPRRLQRAEQNRGVGCHGFRWERPSAKSAAGLGERSSMDAWRNTL
jgi:hypothetical protein